MIVLVTGVSGFLGTAVATALADSGHHVRGVVHTRAYKVDELPETTELVWADLNRASAFSNALEGVDAVVHCAWDGRLDPPERYLRNNVDGSLELMRAAIAAGVPQFIHVSSVAVYGAARPTDGDRFEESSAMIPDDDPLDIYPRTKALLERRLSEVAESADLSLCIVRPGLLYGLGRAPAKRVVRVGTRRYALLFGESRNHLPFIHVDDVASLIVRCLGSDSPPVVNAVPTQALSSNDFATRWARRQPMETRVLRLPLPVARSLALSSYRAKRLLGRPALRPNVTYQMTTATRNVLYSASLASSLGWSDERTEEDRSVRS